MSLLKQTGLLFICWLGMAHAEDVREMADRAIALLQQGKAEQAIVLFRKALALNPQSQDARFNLALACFHARQFQESLTVVTAGSRHRAEDYALMGANYRELGNLDDAIACMRKAVRLKPDDSDFVYDLGITLVRNENPQEAATVLEAACAKPHAEAKLFGALGMALFMTGKNSRAEQAYGRAIAIEPEAADLRASLGDVFFGSGEYQKAAAEYSAAVKIDAGNPEYHNKAGRNFLRLDQQKAAAQEFRSALTSDARNPEALFNLGKIAASEGKLREAVSFLEQAVAADPNGAEAYYQLSLSYQRSGEKDKAAAAMERFRQLKSQK